MFQVFAVQAGWIKKRRGSFFERYSMFEPVAFRLSGIPLEHLLCIYNIRDLHKEVPGTYRATRRMDPVLFILLMTLAMFSQLHRWASLGPGLSIDLLANKCSEHRDARLS